ncbi:Cna B-type domain-containing protein, partial [Streptococcus minor]
KNQVAEWTSEAGKSKIIDLKPGKYVFHEEAAPNGYVAVTDITFQVNYDGTVTVLETNSNAVEYKDGKLVITDQYDESTRSIKVQKIWKDNQNASKTRPDSITIRLFADGKEIAVATVKPDASGDWSHTFDKLPIYNKGVLVAYTVKEDKVNGYETSVGELKDGQIEVVNTYIPSKPKKNKVNLPKTGSTESALTLIVGLLLLGMAYTMKRKND